MSASEDRYFVLQGCLILLNQTLRFRNGCIVTVKPLILAFESI